MMTGLGPDDVERAVRFAIADGPVTSPMPGGYEMGDVSNRLVRFIASTASRHHDWAGLHRNGSTK
jgi:hypothetical protein